MKFALNHIKIHVEKYEKYENPPRTNPEPQKHLPRTEWVRTPDFQFWISMFFFIKKTSSCWICPEPFKGPRSQLQTHILDIGLGDDIESKMVELIHQKLSNKCFKTWVEADFHPLSENNNEKKRGGRESDQLNHYRSIGGANSGPGYSVGWGNLTQTYLWLRLRVSVQCAFCGFSHWLKVFLKHNVFFGVWHTGWTFKLSQTLCDQHFESSFCSDCSCFLFSNLLHSL